jgi:hypothetical protein
VTNQVAAADASVCDVWATVEQAQSIGDKYASLADDQLEDGLLIASDLLYQLTGRVWPGTCALEVRPCARRLTTQAMKQWNGGDDVTHDTSWGVCGCAPLVGCTCDGRSRIGLGRVPVVTITTVKVDGVTLDPSLYWVEDERWLVRLPNADGTDDTWPCCQDLTLAEDQPDTFAVDFVWGRTPPVGGQMAAAQLGGEIALDLAGADTCSLADGVTSLTRQGVTLEAVVPSTDLVDQLPELARAWVRSVNPLSLRRRPSVWWPGSREAARVDT